jgi:predicted TIM-barrel enzyme
VIDALGALEDAQYVLERTQGVDGFYGASSMERLPVEGAIRDQMRAFKAVRFKK